MPLTLKKIESTQQWQAYIFYASTFLIPFLVPNLHGKLIVALFVIWLFCNPRIMLAFRQGFIRVSLAIVIILILGLTYSSNGIYGLKFLETSIVLIILPLIILSSPIFNETKCIHNSILAFVGGVLLLNLSSLYFISYDLWDNHNLQSNLILANNVIVSIHPTFLSMYISLSLLFLADRYFPLRLLGRSKIGWVVFGMAVLIVFLFWLSSRAGILAFSLAALFFIGLKWSGKTRLLGLIGLVIFLLLIFLLPFSKHRFLSTPKMVLTGKVTGFENDPSVYPLLNRIQVLTCDIALLKWPEILFGYGTGDFRDELQVCFEANGYERPLAEGMDSHSEYFAQLHRNGIIGLVLFFALLIVPFRHALKYRSPLLGAFIILFAVTALFENVFSAQKGVTFFALFCPLLWLYAKQEHEAKLGGESSSKFLLKKS